MSTIDTIVRELEQIPEPMQLSVLAFIRSLDRNNRPVSQVEQEATANNKHSGKRRTTSALIAGKGRTLGDIVSSIDCNS